MINMVADVLPQKKEKKTMDEIMEEHDGMVASAVLSNLSTKIFMRFHYASKFHKKYACAHAMRLNSKTLNGETFAELKQEDEKKYLLLMEKIFEATNEYNVTIYN